MNNLPRTRSEARALGLRRYFTGKPCSHGHMAPRHLTGTCVECAKRAVRDWESRNPGAALARSRKYQAAYPDRVREVGLRSKRKAMGIPNPTRTCPTHCELCERKLEVKKIHLDHCHATGIFRGWLCNRCNLALGHLGDSIAGLRKAIAYLERAYVDTNNTK